MGPTVIEAVAEIKEVEPGMLSSGFVSMIEAAEGYVKKLGGELRSRQIAALATAMYESTGRPVVIETLYCVTRPVNGISINGREFLLDNDNNVMVFETKIDAVMFLENEGIYLDEDSSIEVEEYVPDMAKEKTEESCC